MAKIDTSLIEGYESMTPEEKLDALQSFDFEDPDLEALRKDKATYKKRIDELTSELSKRKKAESSSLSRAEQELEDLKTANAELQEKYNAMMKAATIAESKARYLKLGFEESLAEDTANALADGDMDKVFANMEKHQTAFEKKLKADSMRDMGSPDGKGSPSKSMTKEDILKIKDYGERQKAISEHLDLFD